MRKDGKKIIQRKFDAGFGRGAGAGFSTTIFALVLFSWLYPTIGMERSIVEGLQLQQDFWAYGLPYLDTLSSPRTIGYLVISLTPLLALAASLRQTSRILRLNLAWAGFLATLSLVLLYSVAKDIPAAFTPDFQQAAIVTFASTLSLVVLGHRAKRLRLQGALFAFFVGLVAIEGVLMLFAAHSPLLALFFPVLKRDLTIAMPWALCASGLLALFFCGRHPFALIDRRWHKAVRP